MYSFNPEAQAQAEQTQAQAAQAQDQTLNTGETVDSGWMVLGCQKLNKTKLNNFLFFLTYIQK